jgi:hypothetical protein
MLKPTLLVNSSYWRCLFSLVLLLGLVNHAHAYVIEMIIFESKNPSLWLSEYWPALPEQIDADDNDLILGSGSGGRQLLNESQLSLKETAKRLTSTGEFAILAHLAWSQAAETREAAKNTRFPEGMSRNGLPLLGKVKLHKQKFEHIALELQCTKQLPESVASAFAAKQQLPLSIINQQWRFRLQEARKVKLNELQYFDHPMCGALLMVRS